MVFKMYHSSIWNTEIVFENFMPTGLITGVYFLECKKSFFFFTYYSNWPKFFCSGGWGGFSLDSLTCMCPHVSGEMGRLWENPLTFLTRINLVFRPIQMLLFVLP